MGKSSPKPPDPMQTAMAQSEMNRQAALESARMNQVNQTNPFGGVRWSGEIGSPERTQESYLHPMLQAIIFGQGGGQPAGKGGGGQPAGKGGGMQGGSQPLINQIAHQLSQPVDRDWR